TLLVLRDGEARVVTASDRLRADGIGFGVALAHLYPSTIFGDVLAEVERVASAAVHALGMRDGIAYPQLLVTDSSVRIVEVAARIPGGQMVEVPYYGVGVDRRGYVIAVGETNLEALERAEAAARLLDVEVLR